MNKHLLAVAIVTALISFSMGAFAQGPRRGQGMGPGTSIPQCSSLEHLDLSLDQREAVKRIDESYRELVLKNRNQLMVKRFELQGLLRDPQAGKEKIQDKAREMGILREVLQQQMIDYQIQIREILTPDQIRRWCTMMGEPQGGWKGDGWCR